VIEISWMAAGATRHGVLKLGVEPDDARVHGARHMQAWPRRSSFFFFFLHATRGVGSDLVFSSLVTSSIHVNG
jgi:hypothetical protein